MVKINHLLVILLHTSVKYALEVIYVYSVCVVEMQYSSVLLNSVFS